MTSEPVAPPNPERKAKRRFRSAAFARMVRRAVPQRSFLIIGISASVLYAMLHSVSILGSLPILKVLLEEEGLHGWVDRAVADKRLDATLVVREATGGVGQDPPAEQTLIVQEVRSGSALFEQGLRAGDEIRTLGRVGLDPPSPIAPRDWLQRVSTMGEGETLRFEAVAPGRGRASAISYEIVLKQPPAPWRIGQALASWIPRESARSDRVATLTAVLSAVVVIVILANICRFISQYFIGLGVLRSMMDLRRALYAKILRLPMSRFTRDVGDIVSRMVQDVQDVQRGIMSLFGKTIREPLKAVFILIVALMMDWRITVTMIVVAPWAVLLFWKVGASVKKANKKLLRGYGSMISGLSETLNAIGVVKAYTNENFERLRLWQLDRRMFRQQIKIVRLEAILSPALEVIGVFAVAVVTVWLGSRVIAQDIDPAKFGALVITLGMMFDPLRKMADVYIRVSRSSASAERLFEILDAKEESELFAGATVLEPLRDRIEFRDVTFVYPGAETPALDNVNLTVTRGETVALVGRNGSGKTTLINMLTRFYDPQHGSIVFDGVDIRNATLRSLRKQIGLVSQNAVVFPISLADNISYGTRNGSRDRVVDAAKRAYADEFIRTRPQGYETVPGDRGKTLSGGQQQRIAIARAILRDPAVLIFDEATSQIDSESEQKIQAALKEIARDRTTFIVAHRLSTIRFADRIVVMEAGRIIDTGSHDDLLERCPLYHGLCDTQLLA